MLKLMFILLLTAYGSLSLADSAKCTIEIQDVNTGEKTKESFTFKQSNDAQRNHFNLPNSTATCTLAFFNLQTGTMLSCQLGEIGNNFVQSDRSSINDGLAKNNLSFRYKKLFYSIESKCN